MATFPTGIFSWVTKIDNVDAVLANDPNSLAAEIIALETKVGATSSAVASSLDYFLKNASGAYRTHKHDASSDDGAATIGPLTGLTIANNIDVGDYQVRAKQIYADVPTGTAPFVTDSTTLVSNLNAEKVNSLASSDLVQIAGTQTVTGNKTFSGDCAITGSLSGQNFVKKEYTLDGALHTTTTTVPIDNTDFLSTEGGTAFSDSITPTDATNLIKVEVILNMGHSVAGATVIGGLFKDAEGTARIVSGASLIEGGAGIVNVKFTYWMVAGTTSAITFTVKYGSDSVGTAKVNGNGATGALFNGTYTSSITMTEYKA